MGLFRIRGRYCSRSAVCRRLRMMLLIGVRARYRLLGCRLLRVAWRARLARIFGVVFLVTGMLLLLIRLLVGSLSYPSSAIVMV